MRATPLPLASILRLALALALSVPAHAATTTQTTLTISPSASVQHGTTVTLTAHVTANGTPVHPGTVIFCNAAAPHCEDAAILGTAQLTSDGTARLPLRLGVDTYTIKAIFKGTPHSATPRSPSTSAAQSLTVEGIESSLTSPPVATKIGNFYKLSSTVAALGRSALSGTVSFTDVVNNGSPLTLRSASLNASPAQFTLTGRISTPIPRRLNTMLTGDFNGDGIPDIVGVGTIVTGVPLLIVLLGQGDGTFIVKTTPLHDPYDNLLAVGDFDSDGKLDIITGGDITRFLRGNGDGTFTVGPESSIGGGFEPGPIMVADINGDGILDLVDAQLLGNGDGTFRRSLILQYLAEPILSADLNGDGIPDLIGPSASGDSLQALLGNPDGTYTTKIAYPSVNYPTQIMIGDLNNDGIPDLLILNSDNTVNTLLGKGDGTFTPAPSPPPSGPWFNASLADVNNDGKLDAVLVTYDPGSLQILFGNGDGTFQHAIVYAEVNSYFVWTAIADFTGDGFPDIAGSSDTPGFLTSVVVLPGALTKAAVIEDVHLQSDFIHTITANYSGSTAYSPSSSHPTDVLTFPDVTSKLHITSSGFIYSRVTHTFNGTVTVANISNTTIGGPLQIGFFGLPAGITLANATLTSPAGIGFIAIPAGLGSGQSTSFSVRFSNPANAPISYTTVAYTGAF